MANKLLSVDESLRLPPEVEAVLKSDLNIEFNSYLSQAANSASTADSARAQAEASAELAEQYAQQAQAPTEQVVEQIITDPTSAANNHIRAMLPFVTPQQFGAVGDGVTDDTEAFQSAVDSGELVVVPQGTYVLKYVKINSSVSIVGGPNAVLKHAAGAATTSSSHANAMFQVVTHGITVRFKGLTLDGNYYQQGTANGGLATAYDNAFVPDGVVTYGRLISAVDLTPVSVRSHLVVSVEDCVLQGIQMTGIAIDKKTDTVGTEVLVVRGCTFRDFAPGIAQYDAGSGIGYPGVTNGFDPSAIVVTGGAHAIIDSCTFRGYRDPRTNPTPGKTTNVYNFPANAIRITLNNAGTSDPTPEYGSAVITNCEFEGMGRPHDAPNTIGVIEFYARGEFLRITGNGFRENYSTPIRGKSNSRRVIISENIINNVYSGGGGIHVEAPTYTGTAIQYKIVGNIVQTVDGHGIMVAGHPDYAPGYVRDVDITGNTVQNAGLRGIYTRRVYGLNCSYNYVRVTGEQGVYSDHMHGPMHVLGNQVIEAGGFGIDLSYDTSNQSYNRAIVGDNLVNTAQGICVVVRRAYTLALRFNSVTNAVLAGGNSIGYYVDDVAQNAMLVGNDVTRLVTTPTLFTGVSNHRSGLNTWN